MIITQKMNSAGEKWRKFYKGPIENNSNMVLKEELQEQLLEEDILVEQEAYETAYVVDHALIAELPQGGVINNPNNNEQYTVLEKLPGGGEGHTYLAQTGSAQRKVVKFVSVGLSTTSSVLYIQKN